MAPFDIATPAAYPAELEREITLWDGTHLRLRPIRPDYASRLIKHYSRLGAHQRFFTVLEEYDTTTADTSGEHSRSARHTSRRMSPRW